MKIFVSESEGSENNDFRSSLSISIDGETKFSAYDGEPEDATLARDFNDCYSIPDLLKLAYEAGKRGEDFELEYLDEDK
jgi:hypothetical protein